MNVTLAVPDRPDEPAKPAEALDSAAQGLGTDTETARQAAIAERAAQMPKSY